MLLVRPIAGLYESTVDGGNLAGHLLVVGSACREVMELLLDGHADRSRPDVDDGATHEVRLVLGERAIASG